ncbi:MAG: lysozyme inhibitor LprI family protein, partial [FCB group bacterium]|nr:lysozyme inhibitor LprI family protein [FCB group bacterium]
MKPWSATIALVLWTAGAFGQTQAELNVVADEALKKADAELNAVYKEVMASLDDAGKAALKESQRAWMKYRDFCA